MEKSVEERFARIEESLAKAHRTGIETGAALVGIMRVLCDAIPGAVPGIAQGLQRAIDGAAQADKLVIKTLLKACLATTRRR